MTLGYLHWRLRPISKPFLGFTVYPNEFCLGFSVMTSVWFLSIGYFWLLSLKTNENAKDYRLVSFPGSPRKFINIWFSHHPCPMIFSASETRQQIFWSLSRNGGLHRKWIAEVLVVLGDVKETIQTDQEDHPETTLQAHSIDEISAFSRVRFSSYFPFYELLLCNFTLFWES